MSVMAEYLILIYDDESAWAAADRQTYERVLSEHDQFIAEHSGIILRGDRLRPSDTATTIRREPSGGFTITDAPFAETKEVLGG